MEYDRRNSFILSRNERKEKDTHPDFTGSLTDENGREFWLNAWVKESKGRKFFSGSIKPKDGKPAGASGDLRVQLDDEVPFAPEWR